jgi:hypothetical protein
MKAILLCIYTFVVTMSSYAATPPESVPISPSSFSTLMTYLHVPENFKTPEAWIKTLNDAAQLNALYNLVENAIMPKQFDVKSGILPIKVSKPTQLHMRDLLTLIDHRMQLQS